MSKKFLIIDGYPKEEREKFINVGMTLAGELYENLLLKAIPDAETDIICSSDSTEEITPKQLKCYDGVLWPGCNLSVLADDWRARKMIDICQNLFDLSIPQFGSCWAAQLAVVVSGGKVAVNPKGREMGFARKIQITSDGKNHPMYKNKPPIFEAFASHEDYIIEVNSGCTQVLAMNEFSGIQAVAVNFKGGEFWATQYHPEYNFLEMAYLLKARAEKMLASGFFDSASELNEYSENLVKVQHNRDCKNLNWKYGIDETILDDSVKEVELFAWVKHFFR